MSTHEPKGEALAAAVASVGQPGEEIEVVVRLSNPASRALHYIADVRARRYDPATRTLTLALSDEGREVLPGAAHKLPEFRHIDPHSDAELRLRVPNRIVRLSRSAPAGELAFEQHGLSEIDEVLVEVAWADVPYYKDTRPSRDDKRLPAARWQQHTARASARLDGDGDGARSG